MAKKQGAAHARNTAFRLSSNSIILFLDQDVLVDKNLLRCYRNCLENDPRLDGVQGNIWAQYGNNKICRLHSAWRKSVFSDKIIAVTGYLTTIITRNVAIKKASLDRVYRESGYLFREENNMTGGEDRELGYRLVKRGYKIILEEKAVVFHRDPMDLLSIL